MGLIRTLLFLLAAYLIWRAIRSRLPAKRPSTTEKEAERGGGSNLVQCSACGTWIPKERSVPDSDGGSRCDICH